MHGRVLQPAAEAAPGPFARTALRDGALWAGGLAFALALHAGAAWLALRAPPDPRPPAPPPGAILFALAPLPAAPESLIEEVAPGPEMVQQDAAPPPGQPPEKAEEPVPLPEREPVPDQPSPEPVPEPEPARELRPPVETVDAVPGPADIEPEVAVPPPRRRPADLALPPRTAEEEPPREERSPPPERRAAPRTAAPPAAEARQAPQVEAAPPGRSPARAQVSPQRWQALLLAHLERRKQYPRAARARGGEGVVQLSFSIDRAGNVMSARIARSSGVAALDTAALEMVRRASPVPAPPPELQQLSFTVPIEFALR